MFNLVSEPPLLVRWSGSVWLWPRDGFIRMNSSSNFWEHHFRGLQKFDVWLISFLYKLSFGQSCTPLLHFTKPGCFGDTYCSLNSINGQKWGETPHQNMIFGETLRITILSLSFSLFSRKTSHQWGTDVKFKVDGSYMVTFFWLAHFS